MQTVKNGCSSFLFFIRVKPILGLYFLQWRQLCGKKLLLSETKTILYLKTAYHYLLYRCSNSLQKHFTRSSNVFRHLYFSIQYFCKLDIFFHLATKVLSGSQNLYLKTDSSSGNMYSLKLMKHLMFAERSNIAFCVPETLKNTNFVFKSYWYYYCVFCALTKSTLLAF